MTELDFLMKEHDRIMKTSDMYSDFMYRTINYAVVVFTAVFAFGLDKRPSTLAYQLSFYYALPIFTFVFGLIYAYNACSLAKIGWVGLKQEIMTRIILSQQEVLSNYTGWIFTVKKYNGGGSMFAVGTAFMFFMLLPLASMLLAATTSGVIVIWSSTTGYILSALPFVFEIVYLVFYTRILSNIKRFNDDSRQYDIIINGTLVRVKPKS